MSFVLDSYRRTVAEFQRHIESIPGGLAPRIEAACQVHAENGFLADDLSQSQRYCVHETGGARQFVVQVNPRRAERKLPVRIPNLPAHLAGRKLSKLDLDLIPVTSGYRQFPYTLEVNTRRYAILVNPYPFARYHVTVASTLEADPQGWRGSPDRLYRILADLCELVRQAPGFLGLYNGLAGASVLDKNHFQLMAREPNPWPLQEALEGPEQRVCLADPARYPLSAWRFTGDPGDVVSDAVRVSVAASEIAGAAAAENYLACAHNGVVSLYYVPRDARHIAARPGFVIGSLETFGEMISEADRLDDFFFQYDNLAAMLRSVRPFFAEELARRCA